MYGSAAHFLPERSAGHRGPHGINALRHFYASWCINRQADGGLGLPPKVVQERLGHSSITMTMDVYGHPFPRGDDQEKLAAAERALLGSLKPDALRGSTPLPCLHRQLSARARLQFALS